jgi:TPR repeat protein
MGCTSDGASAAGTLDDLCAGDGAPPCGDSPAGECADKALAAWSHARDDHEVGCVGRKLSESCRMGDARACGFAGRMALEGRGVARDTAKGIKMLSAACDEEVAQACAAAVAWLAAGEHSRAIDSGSALRDRLMREASCLAGQGEDCYRTGFGFEAGQGAFPLNPALAVRAYERGCSEGNGHSCASLGEVLVAGEGTTRDATRAATVLERACSLGEARGCATWGYLFERADGVAKDLRRARTLYLGACSSGDAYGCLHSEMMAITATTARRPGDAAHALAGWQRACEGGDGRACAFAGVLYQDGAEGVPRDKGKATEAMNRGCELGNRRACDWTSSRLSP